MSASVTIQGEASLLRKLTIIPERMKDEIRLVMAQHADEVVEMMRRLCPVEPGKPDLRDTIGWRWGRARTKTALAEVQGPSSDLVITIHAGDNQTFYATFVEFGTVKMMPRPFFFVSWRANRKDAKNKMRAAVRKAAKSVAAGG